MYVTWKTVNLIENIHSANAFEPQMKMYWSQNFGHLVTNPSHQNTSS